MLLLYFAFRGMSFHELIHDLRSVKYSWVILSLLFAFIAYVLRAYRWNLIIEPLNYKPPLSSTFYSLMVGYLANFAFPRIGEITRCATLAKKEKIPVDKLVGTVIIERAIDLVSLMILLLFLIILRFDTFGSFLQNSVFLPLSHKVTNTLGFSWYIWIGIFALIGSGIAAYLIFREQLSDFKLVSRIKIIIKGVIDGLKSVFHMKRRWEFLIYTVLIWFLYLLMTWVVVFSLPATSNLKLIDGLFILVIGGLGMSAPVQSGIGAYHWIVSRGLSTVYTTISLESGLVFATISHESQSLLAIIMGSVSMIMLIKRKKSRDLDPLKLSAVGANKNAI